ncbi:hypothetical protein LINPERPRIM_LOCUS28566 [Linum perenne]
MRRWFVGSCGELLFFHQYFVGWWDHPEADIVTYIRAYKLDVETRRLEEVNDLGDRAFIFDYSTSKNSIGCCTSEFGFKRSSIYFISGADIKLGRLFFRPLRLSSLFLVALLLLLLQVLYPICRNNLSSDFDSESMCYSYLLLLIIIMQFVGIGTM